MDFDQDDYSDLWLQKVNELRQGYSSEEQIEEFFDSQESLALPPWCTKDMMLNDSMLKQRYQNMLSTTIGNQVADDFEKFVTDHRINCHPPPKIHNFIGLSVVFTISNYLIALGYDGGQTSYSMKNYSTHEVFKFTSLEKFITFIVDNNLFREN
jgi:hypothetical protein